MHNKKPGPRIAVNRYAWTTMVLKNWCRLFVCFIELVNCKVFNFYVNEKISFFELDLLIRENFLLENIGSTELFDDFEFRRNTVNKGCGRWILSSFVKFLSNNFGPVKLLIGIGFLISNQILKPMNFWILF